MRARLMLLGAGLATLLPTAGCKYYRWESQRARLAPADVIIVPGIRLTEDGKGTFVLHNRVAMGRYLMSRGYAKTMILTGGNPQKGVTEASKMMELAVDLGVDPTQLVAEPFATSTVENAKNTAALMKAFGWKSALLVTDRVHLGYGLPVFRDAFALAQLDLYWAPVDYDLLKKRDLMRLPSDPPL